MVNAAPAPAHKDIRLFDRMLLRRKRRRAQKNFSAHDFLFQWAAKQLQDRLSDVTRNFPHALQIGARAALAHDKIGVLTRMDLIQNPGCDLLADEEFLPFAAGAFDLILSPLSLHSVNDLPGALIQIRRALKPDGLFLAALFGGETLHELRAALTETELTHKNGASPRVFPFADKQQMGALMQRAGFALPVVDSDILSVTYKEMAGLLADIRGMGEGNIIAARNKAYAGKDFFEKAAKAYHNLWSEKDGRIPASFEIIFLTGWAPHESQQKPLCPGSAKHSLAEALEGKRPEE